MPEPAQEKQLFTRRREIVVAIVLIVALAVAGFVFGVFDTKSEQFVHITFVGFTNSLDGTPNCAELELKKTSDRVAYSYSLDSAVVMDPFGQACAVMWLKARFRSHSPTGDVLWESSLCKTNVNWSTLVASTELSTYFALPEDGRTGRVEVFYWYVKPGLFDSRSRTPSSTSWANSLNGTYFERWAVSDQEIQCPRVRPDGKVEPPRLVPKRAMKQP